MVNGEMVIVELLQTLLKPVALTVQHAKMQGDAG